MDVTLSPGRLLVATPSLADPNFIQTVVLLVVHEAEGTLGVVLNRPGDVDLATAAPGWERRAARPALVFVGGPVERQALIGLGRPATDGTPTGYEEVVPGLGVVDLSRDADLTEVAAVRVYAGHSGWGPGQLAAEIAEGAWFVVDGRPEDVATEEPDDLWLTVVRRQEGVFANFPEDPSLN